MHINPLARSLLCDDSGDLESYGIRRQMLIREIEGHVIEGSFNYYTGFTVRYTSSLQSLMGTHASLCADFDLRLDNMAYEGSVGHLALRDCVVSSTPGFKLPWVSADNGYSPPTSDLPAPIPVYDSGIAFDRNSFGNGIHTKIFLGELVVLCDAILEATTFGRVVSEPYYGGSSFCTDVYADAYSQRSRLRRRCDYGGSPVVDIVYLKNRSRPMFRLSNSAERLSTLPFLDTDCVRLLRAVFNDMHNIFALARVHNKKDELEAALSLLRRSEPDSRTFYGVP